MYYFLEILKKLMNGKKNKSLRLQKIKDLIELSRELKRENRALKLRAAELQRERRELLERQRQASEHVETSLARLRSLDGSA